MLHIYQLCTYIYILFLCVFTSKSPCLRRIYSLNSTERTTRNSIIASIAHKFRTPKRNDYYTGRSELDSHADTMVAGRNCVIINYTDRTCTVSPYNEDEYKPVTGVPIVQAATGYTSKSGRNYILILNEALSMPSLDHSLWNPN